MSAENTGHRIKSERPKLFEEALVKRFSEGRIGRRRKARARAAVGIGSQSELGSDEDSSVDGF